MSNQTIRVMGALSAGLLTRLAILGAAASFLTTWAGAQTDLYVTNYGRNNVLRYDSDTGKLLNAVVGGGLTSPVDLGFGPDGNLYVACSGVASVKRFDGVTGAFLDTVVASHAGGLSWGGFIEFGPNDTLYVGDSEWPPAGKGILKFDRVSGAYLGAFVPPGDNGMLFPAGMGIGPDGNLYVRAGPSNDLLKYDGTSGAYQGVSVPAGNGGGHAGHGIAFDSAGRIFLSDQQGRRIPYYDPASGLHLGNAVPSGPPASLVEPNGIAFSPSGDLYVADWGNSNTVKKFNGTTYAYEGAFDSGSFLGGPYMVAIHPRPTGVPITGHVDLQDFDGDPATQSVEIRVQDSFLGTGGESHTVALDASGNFATTTTVRMRAFVSVKGTHWLRRSSGEYPLVPNGGLSGLSFSLENGDVDGDNEVAIGDFSQLSVAFNSSPGDGNWNANADLNGDDGVDIGDFAILSSNFGTTGDD